MQNFSFSHLTPRHVCSLSIPSVSEAKVSLSSSKTAGSGQSTASMTTKTSFATTHSTDTVFADNKNPTQSAGSLCSAIHPSLSSPITIAFNEFLLAATVDGRVLIYQITDSQEAENTLIHDEIHNAITSDEDRHLREKISKLQQQKNNVEPLCSLGPFFVEYSEDDLDSIPMIGLRTSQRSKAFASIAHICWISSDDDEISDTLGGSRGLGTVAILTNEGNVHIFDFNIEHTNYLEGMPVESRFETGKCIVTASLDSDGCRLKIYKRASLFTGKIGANCVTFHYIYDVKERQVNGQKDTNVPSRSLRMAIGHECGMVVEYQFLHKEGCLVWMGSFDCPVRSICSLGHLVRGVKAYLAVGLAADHSPGNQSINSFLETIDITAVEKAWKGREQTNDNMDNNNALKLDDFCTWPAKTIHLEKQDNLVEISAKNKRTSRALNHNPCARQQLAANIIGMNEMQKSFVLKVSNNFSILFGCLLQVL
jgi:hypothetical protein